MNQILVCERITDQEIEYVAPGTILELIKGEEIIIALKTDGNNWPLVDLSNGYLFSYTNIHGYNFRVIKANEILIR